MRGLVLEGIERVVYRNDLPEPLIEHPSDAVVSVLRAGICGSDLHQVHGRELVGPETIPGHEFVGEDTGARRARSVRFSASVS